MASAFVALRTPNSRNSLKTPQDVDITIVDDDISHTVGKLIELAKKGISDECQDDLQESLGKILQGERNQWKQRLTNAMQEIDRQHKVIIGNQSSLQELLSILNIDGKKAGHPEQILEDEILMNVPSIDNMVDHLKLKVKHLKDLAGVAGGEEEKDAASSKDLKYSDHDIKYMKNAIAKLHWEKQSLQTKLDEKDKQIKWLNGELDTVKIHYNKLQGIVSQYNESHSGSNFHLEVMDSDPRDFQASNLSTSRRHRTYIEGDQLQSYPLGSEENAMWKLRLQQKVYSNKKGNSRTGVAQCLRCRKFFKPSDNCSKACLFHSKGREIKEEYDDNGKIVKVMYKWACCKRGLESQGCSHNYHI